MAVLPSNHPAAALTNRMSPARQLAILLATPKRNGVPFEQAWSYATDWVRWPHDRLQREDWKESTEWSKPFWEAAYTGTDDGIAGLMVAIEPIAA